MSRWRKALVWAAPAALILVSAYLAFVSWQVVGVVDNILRVGTPIAQGAGTAKPERAEDIGYVGDPYTAFDYQFERVMIETELGLSPAWLIEPESVSGARLAIFVHGIGGRRENGYRFLP